MSCLWFNLNEYFLSFELKCHIIRSQGLSLTDEIHKICKISEFQYWKWLCKLISDYVICENVIKINKFMRFNFSYKVMMYVNVLCTDIKFKVFSQDYNFLIVHLNCNCLKYL